MILVQWDPLDNVDPSDSQEPQVLWVHLDPEGHGATADFEVRTAVLVTLESRELPETLVAKDPWDQLVHRELLVILVRRALKETLDLRVQAVSLVDPDLLDPLVQPDLLVHEENLDSLDHQDRVETQEQLDLLDHLAHQAHEDLEEILDRPDLRDLKAIEDRMVHQDSKV